VRIDELTWSDWELIVEDRNGSVETIKKIIGYLNDAKLDPNTGS
jgi:hypothetical protein